MNAFQYVAATSPQEALSLIGPNGSYLAGGIDLLGEMKDYLLSPDVVVDVKGIATNNSDFSSFKLGAISSATNTVQPPGQPAKTTNFYRIGALTTVAEIAASDDLKKALPGLVEAASEVGSPQIRNVATAAGNLLQHSRCWYYRQPDITCLKRGGKICYAQEGESKYSSLFSGCACITPFTSNLGVMLAALDGSVVATIQKTGKLESLSMHKLYSSAWTDPAASHSLKDADFISEIHVPTKRTRSAYRQQSEKSEFDWALVSCAAAGNVTDGKITDVRIALGAVAPVPYMVEKAHHFLEGKLLNDENASRAADLILHDAKPLAQNGYKLPLAHTLIRRALLALNP